jgi:Na+/H+-dicarboxylate symporter
MIGLGLGIASGLFIGEPMGVLKVLGDVFIRLLQMTVLPYVMVSLIAGLGRLDYREAKRLGLWGGGLLVLLWAMAFAMVAAMPLAFPDLLTASFFSSSLVESHRQVDFVELYVPSNFFYSLANNIVPAVVIFSLALGIALIGIERKSALLDSLDTLGNAMLRVTDFIVGLTPFGVFAIAASSAGTMSVEEFDRIQVYLITYVAFSVATAYWLLPGLVSALTPLRYRDIVGVSKDCMMTAFATGSSFVVIPLLAEHAKELMRKSALEHDDDGDDLIDVIIPASFSFPHSAKVLTLSFIVFAGWFSNTPVPVHDYPMLALSGIASTFGSVNIAIPFLLDLMELPHDLFQLFVATSVINSRVGTLVQAMHILALTLLGTCALTGILRVRLRPVLFYAGTTILLVAGIVIGSRLLFAYSIDTTYAKDKIIKEMGLLIQDPIPSVVHREPPPARSLPPGQTRLEVVKSSGVLRACYRPDALPFTHFNTRDEFVGLDVEMVNSLARGLGLSVEFVPLHAFFAGDDVAEKLDSGYCDMVISRPAVSMARLGTVAYTETYFDLTLALLVEDHRRREFSRRDLIDETPDLRIACPNEPYYLEWVQLLLPNAEIVPVPNVETFLSADEGEYDAMIFGGEILSSYSLLNPNFGVVVPKPSFPSVPAAFMVPIGEPEWRDALDSWVILKRTDGTVQKLYDYWVQGKDAEIHEPRWSVIRNVLHWVD